MAVDRIDLEIPDVCVSCGFRNFKLWGSKTNGVLRVRWRCMRCGHRNWEIELEE